MPSLSAAQALGFFYIERFFIKKKEDVMPGGGGNPLVQAVSYQMKHYHPGSFPKSGKVERHILRLSNDPVAGLRRQAYYLKCKPQSLLAPL